MIIHNYESVRDCKRYAPVLVQPLKQGKTRVRHTGLHPQQSTQQAHDIYNGHSSYLLHRYSQQISCIAVRSSIDIEKCMDGSVFHYEFVYSSFCFATFRQQFCNFFVVSFNLFEVLFLFSIFSISMTIDCKRLLPLCDCNPKLMKIY